MTQTDFPLIFTGASGRVGRLVRRAATGDRVVWVTRNPVQTDDLSWEMLLKGVPEGAVILHFAGAVRGDFGVNATLAQKVCALRGVRHVFVASTAAVYRPGENDLGEDMAADPQNAYGHAKLEMENAVRGPGVTLLRIGNVAGADALLGGLVPDCRAILDPVPGQAGGPLRSYIGPVTLWRVLMRLAQLAARGTALPEVLNVAAPGAVGMADLLNAARADWMYGPPRADVVGRVVLDTGRMCGLVPVAAASPADIVSEWQAVR